MESRSALRSEFRVNHLAPNFARIEALPGRRTKLARSLDA